MEQGEENINWEEISKVMRGGKTPSGVQKGAEPSKIRSSKVYDSLYEELLDKCNPKNFMVPYDKDKVGSANLIYKALLENKPSHKCYSNQEIRDIKDQAVRELGIFISDSLYQKLINYCDPKRFMEPYDFKAVQVANEFYALIEKKKDDIVELEGLRHEISQNEVLKSYRSKEDQEKEDQESMIYSAVVIVLVILAIIGMLTI